MKTLAMPKYVLFIRYLNDDECKFCRKNENFKRKRVGVNNLYFLYFYEYSIFLDDSIFIIISEDNSIIYSFYPWFCVGGLGKARI